MVLQYFYSSEYSLMLFGETWKCKVWIHSSGKFANSSEFNVTSTDGMIRLRFNLMSFKIDGIIFSKNVFISSRVLSRALSPSDLLKRPCKSSRPSNFSSHTESMQSSRTLSLILPSSLMREVKLICIAFRILRLKKALYFLFKLPSASKFANILVALLPPLCGNSDCRTGRELSTIALAQSLLSVC